MSIKDFAVVGASHGQVLIEANEWDEHLRAHRVVTLYLEPRRALRLADELTACAGAMRDDIGSAV